jgi:hypothetical protein
VKIALVGEGITDYVVLKAAIESMLDGRSFILTLLQPEGSVAFTGAGEAGPLGGGWKGVHKWCLQSAARGGGSLSGDPLFIIGYDLLLLHLDADVAREDSTSELFRCQKPCPPPSATTNRLRAVMLSWLGEEETPPQTVLCTPSKATEAWVMAACFPTDKEVKKKSWECQPHPESRLGQQPKSQRFSKCQADYDKRQSVLQAGWPAIVAKLSEAARFQNDFTTAVQALPSS